MHNRRAALKSMAGGAIGACTCSLSSLELFARQVGEDAHKPNILCLVGEGLRWDEFSMEGNKILHTPNMDRIGQEGCTFHNSFVVNA